MNRVGRLHGELRGRVVGSDEGDSENARSVMEFASQQFAAGFVGLDLCERRVLRLLLARI